MKKIYIPQGGGRDFWLRIPMNNESAGRHLCMDDVDENDMHVWLESGYGGCWTLVWEKDGAQRDGIAAEVPASQLGYGTYSVVMAGKFVNGDYFRTKRQLFIRLVDREDQADAEPTMYNEEQAYWAGPAVLSEMLSRDGLNTYELWILQGNEGTMEQFLAFHGFTLNDYMVHWNHLSVDVQTKIQRGEEKGIEVMGDYSATTTYDVNDLVFDPTTNSSYISKHASNTGNALTDTDHWMKTMDGTDVLRAIEDADDATDAANTAAATAESAAAGAVTTITEALTGYFTCGASTDKGGLQTKVVDNDHDYIKPSYGGAMKIRMYQVNTYVPTTGNPVKLKIGDETAAELLYNREPVTPDNSWEENEVLSVYYDGSVYQASNAQGGGGKAEKIKYDNSESGLTAENVQGALDEIQENTGIIKLMDLTFCQPQNFNLEQNVTKWSSSSEYKCFVVPRCLFGDRLYLLPLTYKISYAFLQYCNLRSNSTVQFAGGMTHEDTIAVGSSKWVDIPNDCNCIYFYLSLYDIANINTLYSVYSVSKVKDDLENLIEPHWDTKEFNEAKSSIMPSGYNSNTGIYENTYDPAVTYNRAISTIPFKLEKGEWIKITMDSSVKAFVMSIGENNYYYGNDTGGPQTGGTIIAQGDGNKKVIWTAFANDANILTANDVISHISIVKGYDYRYEPTKVSVSERYNTTIQSDLVSNLALCSWAVYDAQGVAFPIPFQEPYNTRCCSASIEWIEDDILVSFPNTILSCCYDMGLDKIYKGRASLVVDKPYIVKGGRYIILWFKNADDSEISSLSDFVAQISVTNISAEDTVKGLVENNIFNAFNDTSGRKVFGIARSNNHPHEHLSIYTQMDFFNEYYQLSSLQSSPYNKEKGYILHLTGSTDGTICPIDGIGQYPMTLPSMGHENDAFIDGDEMWTADGSALGSGGFTDIYKYLFSTGTATKYTLDISSSTGATMVVGGICKYSDTELLIAAYDYRGNYNNEGDELRIYKVNKSTMAVELLFTTQWDGWFVQGMTYVNGFAYIASNMIPPTSGDAYYSGINIWKIDMLGTPAHIDTLQLFGDFEPEGMDSYSLNGIDYLLLGIGKYSTIGQLTRMVAF